MISEQPTTWLKEKEYEGLAWATLKNYEATWRLYIEPTFHRAEDFTQRGMRLLILDVANTTSPRKANEVKRVASAFLSWAAEAEIIDANPLLGMRMPKVVSAANTKQQSRVTSVPPEEDVLDVAYRLPDSLRLVPLMGMWAGLRFGEIAGLRPQDVNVKSRRIFVWRQVNQRGQMDRPKTHASTRDVIFCRELLPHLKYHLGQGFGADTLVATDSGVPLRYSNFYNREWRPRTDLRFHTTRHIYATKLIGQGVAAPLLARLMGHSTPQVTLDIYTHFFQEDLDGLTDLI